MTEVKKMAIPPTTAPGVETDGMGNYIPLEKRTEEDQAKVKAAIVRATAPDEARNKDPNGECENPAPFEEGQLSQNKPKHHDLQGQQGGQKGGSREPS
jgi:hypothetical protein